MAEATAKSAQNNHHRHQDKETVQMNEEIAELEALEPLQYRSIYDKVYEQAERFSTTSLGQYVIKRADRALKMIEDTAKWSVPQVKILGISTLTTPLERPLPWIPFLSLIIILRLIRIWLSVGAVMIGNAPVLAADVVYFIQVRRRKLRALRVHGLKQRREQESKAMSSANMSQQSFISKLRSLFSHAFCQPGMQNLNNHVVVIPAGMFQEKEKKRKETVQKSIHVETDTDDNDDVGYENDDSGNILQNMTVQEMLEKYAKDSSTNDSDFVPDEDESSDEDISETDDSERELLPSNGLRKNRVNGNDNTNDELRDKVKLKQNGDLIPLPILEMKLEPLSDDNSHVEKIIRNGTKEHDSESVAAKNSNKIETPKQNDSANINVEKNVEQKSTPGHMSAAMASTRQILNNAATAASTNRRRTNIDNDNSNQVNQVNEIESNLPTNVVVAASGYSKDDPTPLPTSQTLNDPVIPDPSSNLSANLLEAKNTSTTTPSLEKCDNTDSVTPASSSEDLFYSPIGSPTEFNADFLPPSILKQPTVISSAKAAGNGSHSTQISEAETEENDMPAKKHVTLQNQQNEEKQKESQQQAKQQQQDQQQKLKQHEEQQQEQQKQKQHEDQQQQQQQKQKQHDEQQQQQKQKQHEEQQQQEQHPQQHEEQQHQQQHQQQQQYQKHNNHNNRFRGRNRR